MRPRLVVIFGLATQGLIATQHFIHVRRVERIYAWHTELPRPSALQATIRRDLAAGHRAVVTTSPTKRMASLIGWPLGGVALAELEYGPVAGAQLAEVAGYSGSYLVARTLALNV